MKLPRFSLFLIAAVIYSGCEKSPDNTADNSEQPFSAAYFENMPVTGESSTGGNEESTTESLNVSRTNAITRSVEKASNAVVSIMATETIQRYQSPRDEFFRHFFRLPRENTNIGSGFIISEDGLVVTNQHVVGNSPSELVVSMTDGSSYDATLIGSDELTDIALLRINSDQSDQVFPFVTISDSDEIIVGEWAIALGNPFGLFEDGKPTVTVGVISAKNRDFRPDPNNPRVYLDMVQTDAAINRGNSGGPLLNSDGEVIGINTFIYTGGTSAGFVGLGFAIPSNRIEKIVTQLLTGGTVVLDYDPGMEFTSMTDQLVYRYNLPYVQGLLVTSVNKGGPAFESGIMPGDVILRIGKERVVGEMHAWALLRDYDEGDKMNIELLRENNLYQAEMILRQKSLSVE
ncbi:MAG: trypsin-like peptidase domain-containing protein [Balneolaceae bacterium]